MTPLESAILREMARPVVDNRTERGCCGGCGECCGRVLPLSVFDVARLKAYVERNGIEPSPGSWIDGDGLTVNMMCPFLDEERMCKVYEARDYGAATHAIRTYADLIREACGIFE